MPQAGKKSYGRMPIKRIDHALAEIPEDCGYMQRFRFNIDMNSNGIMGECIEWCQVNCKGKWGWWFENANKITNPKKKSHHASAQIWVSKITQGRFNEK